MDIIPKKKKKVEEGLLREITFTVRSSLPLTTWSALCVNTAEVTVLNKQKKKLQFLTQIDDVRCKHDVIHNFR